MPKNHIRVFASEEDEGWIAVDDNRPGCSAWGQTEYQAVEELGAAMQVWDEACAAAIA